MVICDTQNFKLQNGQPEFELIATPAVHLEVYVVSPVKCSVEFCAIKCPPANQIYRSHGPMSEDREHYNRGSSHTFKVHVEIAQMDVLKTPAVERGGL